MKSSSGKIHQSTPRKDENERQRDPCSTLWFRWIGKFVN